MEPLQMENEATRASLELLYHISRELVSALDLRTVLLRVLSLSMENIGASSGSIIVLDEMGRPLESAIIVADQVHESATEQLNETMERGLAGWVVRHREAVLLSDTSQDERWLRRPDDDDDQTGAKSAASVPILVRERLVGVMTLVHAAPGFFTQDHFQLLQAIVDQAGIAILNAQFYAESQRQARVMTAIAESAEVITASLNLDDVLQRILEQTSQALRVEAVSLALVTQAGDEVEFRAATGRVGQEVVGKRLKMGQGISGWVAQQGQGVIVPDAYNDPRFHPLFDYEIGYQSRSVACAPIRAHNQVIGVIEAVNPLGSTFDQDALLVLTGVGSMAGTAIRHAQLFERLQAAHQRYRELFEDSVDPILLTDWDGRIIEANRQAEMTTGLSRKVLRQRYVGDLNVMDFEQCGDCFENLVAGETISYESELQSQDKGVIPVQVYVRQVMIDGLAHLQWILRDITERKDLDNLRDDLISMIYHDLRSPLANVVSSLDVLASMLPLDDEQPLQSLLGIAVRSTERIQRLTDSLLDINRLEAGQQVGNRQPASPAPIVNDAVEAIQPIAQNKRQSVIMMVEENLPYVFIDVDMIKRVLINLLENAVKFSPPGGKIWVGAVPDEACVRFWVQDTGPGIPPGEQERIFDKFARLQAKDGPKGLGLGLAYCRLAVIGHNGQIWVESEPNTGSKFIFTLPITSAQEI